MKILLTGGTGFIGERLSGFLEEKGHKLTILSREPDKYRRYESTKRTYVAWRTDIVPFIENSDAVINLAGKNIFDKRWNRLVKKQILDSRVSVTRALVTGIKQSMTKPSVMVSASGVSIYGDKGDQLIDEPTPPGSGFLAEVCKEWESEAQSATDEGVRVVITRFGLPLGIGGGALKPMLLPFNIFVGGPLGTGRQYFPWIHLEDLCRAILYTIENQGISGAVNVAAPNPVTMNELAGTLGHVMNRPSWLKVPSFLLRIAVGEVADTITDSLRIIPRKLTEHGFEFNYTDLEEALKEILYTDNREGILEESGQA